MLWAQLNISWSMWTIFECSVRVSYSTLLSKTIKLYNLYGLLRWELVHVWDSLRSSENSRNFLRFVWYPSKGIAQQVLFIAFAILDLWRHANWHSSFRAGRAATLTNCEYNIYCSHGWVCRVTTGKMSCAKLLRRGVTKPEKFDICVLLENRNNSPRKVRRV